MLDVGCGTGHLVHLIGSRGTGVDASLSMLSRATGSRVCAQAWSLPFPDTAFDTVVSTAFLGVICACHHRRDDSGVPPRDRLLEPLAPLSRVRRALALAPHPLTVDELSHAGVRVVDLQPPVLAGVYTPVVALPR